MNYSFEVGFQVLDTANYSSLTAAQRDLARLNLLALVQDIVDRIGRFDVSVPHDRLETILTDASTIDDEWAAGLPLAAGDYYYTNPVTGEVICRRGFALELNGNPYVGGIEIGGKPVRATFYVSYSAENGSY